jgi:4'-phosphopantetheinyl transferase
MDTARKMRENELHVWRVELGAMREAASDAVLSEMERHRARQFRFERDRRRYVAAHVALRRILAGYLEAAPASLQFSTTDHGKPELADGPDLRFNLSHSGDCALVAVTWGRRVGVDIEQHRDDLECMALARTFFSRQEIRELEQVCASERRRAFFDCWTRKEAYVKAVGLGLSHPLDAFSVPSQADLDEPFALSSPVDGIDWRLWALKTRADCSAAVVIEGLDVGEVSVYEPLPH